MTELIPSQREAFDIPADVAYLNCAYMSPLARTVVEAGEVGLRQKMHPWQISPDDFFPECEEIRRRFAALTNADAEGVAIVPSTSYGIAVAARNLPLARGQQVLVLAEQFPSNVYSWMERAKTEGAGVLTVPTPADGDWTTAILERLTDRVAVATMPHCHWVDGALIDLAAVATRCRELDIRLVLDVTQSAGAWPIDIGEIRPDFVACAGYKWLLGPYSYCVVWAAETWRDGVPLEHNWIARAGADDFANLLDYRDDFQPGARRFDVGERSNFALAPMLNQSLGMLLDWSVPRIAATLRARTDAIAKRAESVGFRTLPRERRAGHYLGLRLPPGKGREAAQALGPGLAAAKVFVSIRGDSVRITPHVYNTDTDVDRLFDALSDCGYR